MGILPKPELSTSEAEQLRSFLQSNHSPQRIAEWSAPSAPEIVPQISRLRDFRDFAIGSTTITKSRNQEITEFQDLLIQVGQKKIVSRKLPRAEFVHLLNGERSSER